MASSTVHFRVSGEFLTEHIRDRWVEGDYAGAIRVAERINGLTKPLQEDLIFGRKKLIGEGDSIDLVDDSWEPIGHYPSILDVLGQGSGKNDEELHRYRHNDAYNQLYENFYDIKMRAGIYARFEKVLGHDETEEIFRAVMKDRTDKHALEDGWDEPVDRPDPMIDIHERARKQMADRAAEMGLDPSLIPDAEAIMSRGYGTKPEKCPDMSSRSGWLLPNGDYYGCGSMEHIGLAHELLKDKHPHVASGEADPEQFAEALGWVKIAHGILGTHVVCQKKVCQRQLDKIFDYATLHGADYEKLIYTLDT